MLGRIVVWRPVATVGGGEYTVVYAQQGSGRCCSSNGRGPVLGAARLDGGAVDSDSGGCLWLGAS